MATAQGTAWYVNWADRSCVRLVNSSAAAIADLAVSPDGRFALSGCSGGAIRVWSLATTEQIIQFQPVASHKSACTCVAFSPDSEHCAAGFGNGVLRLFDLSKIDLDAKFAPHSSGISALIYSPDGATAARLAP